MIVKRRKDPNEYNILHQDVLHLVRASVSCSVLLLSHGYGSHCGTMQGTIHFEQKGTWPIVLKGTHNRIGWRSAKFHVQKFGDDNTQGCMSTGLHSNPITKNHRVPKYWEACRWPGILNAGMMVLTEEFSDLALGRHAHYWPYDGGSWKRRWLAQWWKWRTYKD